MDISLPPAHFYNARFYTKSVQLLGRIHFCDAIRTIKGLLTFLLQTRIHRKAGFKHLKRCLESKGPGSDLDVQTKTPPGWWLDILGTIQQRWDHTTAVGHSYPLWQSRSWFPPKPESVQAPRLGTAGFYNTFPLRFKCNGLEAAQGGSEGRDPRASLPGFESQFPSAYELHNLEEVT